MAFCRSCGMKLLPNARFCNYCGSIQNPSAEEPTVMSESLQSQSPSRDVPTVLSTELPSAAPQVPGSEQNNERQLGIPPSGPTLSGGLAADALPPTPNVPMVQGTSPISGVPTVQGVSNPAPTASASLPPPQPGTLSALPTATAGASAGAIGAVTKIALIAIISIGVVVGGIKVVPILVHGGSSQGTASHQKNNHPIVTVPMPPTQTSCPAQGTARAAVMALLILGKHQNVVYVDNEGLPGLPTSATLKRYDVTTGRPTEIVKLANASIYDAQVSADGQWVLFVAQVSGQAAIQMIRMDGQGLQTLYCASTRGIGDLSWSPDQKLVMFVASSGNSNGDSVCLLNLTNGTFQEEIVPQASNDHFTQPRSWLDFMQVYILSYTADGASDLYILNIKDGAQQRIENLQPVTGPGGSLPDFGVFDISPDGTQLFVIAGSSSITVRSATGGSERTIFTNPTLSIEGIRVITSTSLLLYIFDMGGQNTGQAGYYLYKVQMDGAGFTQVLSVPKETPRVYLNQLYTWSIASRDGSMYAIQEGFCGNSCHDTLVFGSLRGGASTTLATTSDHNSIAGWTTM